MLKVTAYKCDGCGKISRRANVIKKHEATCAHVEENKACATCWNFQKASDTFSKAPRCNVNYFAKPTTTNPIGLRMGCKRYKYE